MGNGGPGKAHRVGVFSEFKYGNGQEMVFCWLDEDCQICKLRIAGVGLDCVTDLIEEP